MTKKSRNSSLKSTLKAFDMKVLKQRLWWFDVVYPITVALLIFSSLTYVVYSGQRSSRLALLGEQKLLETSLKIAAGREPKARGEVLVVSADALDVKRLGRAPLGVAPEPSAASFASVIQTLADQGVKTVFVRWNMDAHPNDEIYYLPLVETLRRLTPATKVYFATSSSMLDATPATFKEVAKVVEDELCNYPDRLHSDCPFNPDWPDWIMQALIDEALTPAAKTEPVWLTLQMPSIAPSYLLNLPAPRSLPTRSFSSLLGAGNVPPSSAKVAFVGSDLSHGIARTNNSSVVRFVRTAYDPADLDFSVAGTPLHVFWAMTSQMLHDHAMVTVPPEWAVILMTVALGLMVIFVMGRFGGTAASGMFVVFVLSGPVLNGWAIRHLNVYAPIFDSFYFGLSTFIVTGFGRLSYTAFHKWRLSEQRRMHVHTADLKGNFISLLSHNLNTPVAKMQGMLGLLAAVPGDQLWKADVRTAEFHVTQLEYAIRGVLLAAALEERSLSPVARSLKAILSELTSVHRTSLKRLGIALQPAIGGDEEMAHVPLDFDVRALTGAMAGLAALYAQEGRAASVTLEASAIEEADRRGLCFVFSSQDAAPPEVALRILASSSPVMVRSLAGQAFFAEVLAGLGVLAARAYDGVVTVGSDPTGGRLEVKVWEPSEPS